MRKAIVRKKGMRLVLEKTGEPICTGDGVTTFRGDAYIVTGGEPPRHENSTGRIYVRVAGDEMDREFVPSVFDCKWVADQPDALNQDGATPGATQVLLDEVP